MVTDGILGAVQMIIDEWYESKLYKGIEDTMSDLGHWY